MINAKMLCKTNIDQAVITTPFVGMDDDVKTDIAAYNGLQRAFLAIRDDLGINPSVTLENAKDDGFAARSATSFAANPFAAEIGLVNLDLARLDRFVTSTFFRKTNTDLLKDRVNTFPSELQSSARQSCRPSNPSQNIAIFDETSSRIFGNGDNTGLVVPFQ